jgi:hypothetical protein
MVCDAFLPEELALLDRVAARIVELHLEVPALLTLEGARPLNVLAGQALYFFEPIVSAFLRIRDYRQFARLIERRETVDHLLERIESHADTAHEAQRVAREARRAARRDAPLR